MVQKKAKSKADLEVELRVLKASRLSDALTSIALAAIKWVGIVAIAYFSHLSVKNLAGLNTTADIVLSVLGDINVSVAVAWGVGMAGIFYGRRQNKLRKDVTERLQGRIQKFELGLDPNRTTSALTPRGETNPEDRL